MNSDGWMLTTSSDSQRFDPLTDLPMPGISTSTSSSAPPMKSQIAPRCQTLTGTWNATTAAARPTARNAAWRARKYQARAPVWSDASAIAIDAEYTITSPSASSSSVDHASDTS